MLARVGRWYLAPFVPGLLLFLLGQAKASGMGGSLVFLLVVAFPLLVFGGIWMLNRRAAALLRARIARSDRARTLDGYRDRKRTRLNSSHSCVTGIPSIT